MLAARRRTQGHTAGGELAGVFAEIYGVRQPSLPPSVTDALLALSLARDRQPRAARFPGRP